MDVARGAKPLACPDGTPTERVPPGRLGGCGRGSGLPRLGVEEAARPTDIHTLTHTNKRTHTHTRAFIISHQPKQAFTEEVLGWAVPAVDGTGLHHCKAHAKWAAWAESLI